MTPYDDKYFQRRRQLMGDDYLTLAETLRRMFSPTAVLDVGCGNGLLLDPLSRMGVNCVGVESAVAAKKHMPEDLQSKVLWADIFDSTCSWPPSDLVCCIEVAEHLPASQADDLVRRLVGVSSVGVRQHPIVFSAAHPGQPGHGHVNCRGQVYWQLKFGRFGYRLDFDVTRHLLFHVERFKQVTWLKDNLMVLAREE